MGCIDVCFIATIAAYYKAGDCDYKLLSGVTENLCSPESVVGFNALAVLLTAAGMAYCCRL